jgi:deoxyribonuclease-4
MLFGTAGVPHSASGSDPASGVLRVAELGLGAMELEFVHGVRIRDEMADRVRRVAEENEIALTCHGPYYINLNAQEKEKKRASIKRILDTARAAQRVGARSITFHAAFYMKQDPEKVHRVVADALAGIMDTLKKEKIRVQVRPELTGKPSQYGDLEELLALSKEIEGVLPCIDFSHLHARTGAENSLAEPAPARQRDRIHSQRRTTPPAAEGIRFQVPRLAQGPQERRRRRRSYLRKS